MSTPGTALTIVKLAPDGREAARYQAEVLSTYDPPPWITVSATWTYRTIELDGLSFQSGDQLIEWFSAEHWFNAFAVFSPMGRFRFRGWYANVTFPARLHTQTNHPTLFWHDLYVDLVGLPDGAYTVRDDDELLASGLQILAPDLYARIISARGELIAHFEGRLPPFGNEFPMSGEAAISPPNTANP
jgi:hypothetical protein